MKRTGDGQNFRISFNDDRMYDHPTDRGLQSSLQPPASAADMNTALQAIMAQKAAAGQVMHDTVIQSTTSEHAITTADGRKGSDGTTVPAVTTNQPDGLVLKRPSTFFAMFDIPTTFNLGIGRLLTMGAVPVDMIRNKDIVVGLVKWAFIIGLIRYLLR
jgi:hypothetical protein